MPPPITGIVENGERLHREFMRSGAASGLIGKFAAIGYYSQDWAVGESPEAAFSAAYEKWPSDYFHLVKIGYNAVFSVGAWQSPMVVN